MAYLMWWVGLANRTEVIARLESTFGHQGEESVEVTAADDFACYVCEGGEWRQRAIFIQDTLQNNTLGAFGVLFLEKPLVVSPGKFYENRPRLRRQFLTYWVPF
ncbi:hypothetical protein A1D30_11500 [Acidovorax sp. GW101-3H11]|nr:hypothetical protein A1D30_11500 [Acidovorax sp. GW101-3H11]